MAMLMKGAPVAQAQSEKIEQDCQLLRERGVTPTFGIVRVGGRRTTWPMSVGPAGGRRSLGWRWNISSFPLMWDEATLIRTLEEVNEDRRIHGCLLMRPLPPHLDTAAVGRVLRPEKDVDAITVASMGGMLARAEVGFAPCTATACLELLHHYGFPSRGRRRWWWARA